MKTIRLLHRVLQRSLLAVAYISLSLQFLWALIVVLPPLLESGALDWVIVTQSQQVPQPVTTSEPSPLVWIVAWVVTIIFLSLTVVIIIRLPRTIAKSGENIVHRATDAVLPTLTHHRIVPVKKRKVISKRIMLIVQIVMSIVALIVSLLSPAYHELTRQIIITIAVWLAFFSLIGFIASWLLDRKSATSQTRSPGSRG